MVLLAIAELRWKDFSVVAPYAIACGLIPTLGHAAGKEPAPPWPTLALSHAELIRNFTHVHSAGTTLAASVRRDRWWTVLTSAFCHAEINHLRSNVLNMLVCGRKPSMLLGAQGFAGLFFGGHIAGILNTSGSLKQVENYLNASTGQMLPTQVMPTAASLFTRVTGPQHQLGASAGVFALLGFDLATTLEEVWEFLPIDLERQQVPPGLIWLGLTAANFLSTLAI